MAEHREQAAYRAVFHWLYERPRLKAFQNGGCRVSATGRLRMLQDGVERTGLLGASQTRARIPEEFRV